VAACRKKKKKRENERFKKKRNLEEMNRHDEQSRRGKQNARKEARGRKKERKTERQKDRKKDRKKERKIERKKERQVGGSSLVRNVSFYEFCLFTHTVFVHTSSVAAPSRWFTREVRSLFASFSAAASASLVAAAWAAAARAWARSRRRSSFACMVFGVCILS